MQVKSLRRRITRQCMFLVAFLFLAGGLSACGGSGLSHAAPPVDVYENVTPTGYGQIRFWADATPDNIDALLQQRTALLKRRFADTIAAGRPVEMHFLALSGGGQDGAFGAGLLNGWTESGTRPEFEFEVVTGTRPITSTAPLGLLTGKTGSMMGADARSYVLRVFSLMKC